MTRDDLNALYELDGPFTTVVLATPDPSEDAAEQLRIRWKNVLRQLDGEGASPNLLLDLAGAVGDHHEWGRAIAAIAAGDDLAVFRTLPIQVDDTVVAGAAVPHVAPLLAAEQATVPYVAAEVDRQGAVVWSHGEGDDGDRRSRFEGDQEHVHRGKPGGWSQRRFQQRAENTWEENAKSAARIVAREAARVDAEVVVVAGDVRAVGFLCDHLPKDVSGRVREIDAGLDPGDTPSPKVVEQIDRLVADIVAQRHTELLRTFDEERSQGDRAADGPARTLEALAEARVETLLVGHDVADRTAWFGAEATQVGLDKAVVEAAGATEPHEAALVDVAIRSALLTGAEVEVMPGPAAHGPDGLGAILRY